MSEHPLERDEDLQHDARAELEARPERYNTESPLSIWQSIEGEDNPMFVLFGQMAHDLGRDAQHVARLADEVVRLTDEVRDLRQRLA